MHARSALLTPDCLGASRCEAVDLPPESTGARHRQSRENVVDVEGIDRRRVAYDGRKLAAGRPDERGVDKRFEHTDSQRQSASDDSSGELGRCVLL